MNTFAEQAAEFMRKGSEGRKPLAPRTLKAYQSYLNARLLPGLGSKRLQDINEAVLKTFFDRICPELAPETLFRIRKVFKGVMDSAVDETGRKIYAREWNWDFVDLPAVVPNEQNTPEIGRETLQEAILAGSPEDRLLWGLLAASGLRIGEALAVTSTPESIGNYWDRANRLIIVRCQRHEGGTSGHVPPKTAAGNRFVDLCQSANDFLSSLAPNEGFFFQIGERGLRKHLDRAIPDTGFHAFRRFRITQMDISGAPENLSRFWAGHASKDVHTRYIKWNSRLEERREWAEKIGLGFELPQ